MQQLRGQTYHAKRDSNPGSHRTRRSCRPLDHCNETPLIRLQNILIATGIFLEITFTSLMRSHVRHDIKQ